MPRSAALLAALLLAETVAAGIVGPPERLDPSVTFPNWRFGSYVAVAGATIVVGEVPQGRVTIFERSGSTYVEVERLVTSVEFGRSLTATEDTFVVGAYGVNVGPYAGGASVYVRDGSSWSLQAGLVAPDAAPYDDFGASVSLDGDTLVVGASSDDTVDGENRGSAYVFERSGTAWSFVQKLRASDPETRNFGTSVDLCGTRLAIGAPSLPRGRGYVFERVGGTWTEVAELVSDDFQTGDLFGWEVALEGDWVAVTARSPGKVYLFQRGGSAWTQREVLSDGGSCCTTRYGEALDLEGERLVVGDSGAQFVDVFDRTAAGWTRRARIPALDPGRGFGTSLDLAGSTLLVGAPGDSGVPIDGYAAVFEIAGFESFCDASDGSLASCPCANAGTPDAGCDVSQGTGGVRLDVLAQETSPQNRATLLGSGHSASGAPPVTVIRSTMLDGASPVVFGDGLRCVGTPLVRLAASSASGGTSLHTFGHGTMAGSGEFFYQLWFRNTPAMYCTPDAFNLSNGRIMTW